MKQKYTLSIADMQLNVVTEESRESVDKLVGILDRKMREIVLKSKKCPKNEAALLCALEFCADKIKLKEELEERDTSLRDAKNELAKLESENAKLREELAVAKAAKANVAEPALKAPVAEPAVVEDPVVQAIADAPEEKAASKKKSRNKVGSMFDLLTFSDI